MKRALGITISLVGFALISACTGKGGPLKVDAVEPPQGTTAGGDEISIVGGGFTPGKDAGRGEIWPSQSGARPDRLARQDSRRDAPERQGAGRRAGDVRRRRDFKIANGFRYVEPADGESARRAFFGGQQAAARRRTRSKSRRQ
jgi:hypothetical protein